MMESSEMTFTYEIPSIVENGKPLKITFPLEGENKFRFTLGASLKLLFLNLNADYNFGKYNSASGGLTFII